MMGGGTYDDFSRAYSPPGLLAAGVPGLRWRLPRALFSWPYRPGELVAEVLRTSGGWTVMNEEAGWDGLGVGLTAGTTQSFRYGRCSGGERRVR